MADTDEQERADDDFSPDEPKASKPWLTLIEDAGKAGQDDYDQRCDNIDKQYASMEKLANLARDREFQIFWANIQVLGPSVYSRPPVPVVTPRFKDRRQLPRVTSELLERSTSVAFEIEDIDSVMRLIRDDVIIASRGTAWVRYETKSKDNDYTEKCCIDYVNRKDFRHDPARVWKEVDWVARGAWMTKGEMRKRFVKKSKNAYQDASFNIRKDEDGNDDGRLKARVWEVWSKSKNKVVWVTDGVEVCLDEAEPHLNLDGFFPCPKPAYATVQRNSLIPVPDYVYYKDQIEEINELTARISALSESVKVRAFYPAGAGEIGDAIETAIKSTDDRQVMIGVSDWAMLGSGSSKDMLVWFPTEMVTDTIAKLVELRRQLIDDVYQITGLSDIMRGSTVASETLGAQELKSQYGSIRIRDKQDELIRFARDITRIMAEVMAEEFKGETLNEMSQMGLPTDADIAKQIAQIEQQMAQITFDIQQAQKDPEVIQMAEQNPEQAQQIVQQAQQQGQQLQQQIQQMQETVTIDQVMKLLKEERTRPFILDIETDSTIAPDENAQKQRATEFITAVGGFMQTTIPLVTAVPQSAPLAGEMLKYVANQFRAGRELQTVIEEFADTMAQVASQPKPEQPDPAVIKAQTDAKKIEQEMAFKAKEREADDQKLMFDAQERQEERQFKLQEMQTLANEKIETARLKARSDQDKAVLDKEIAEVNLELKRLDVLIKKADLAGKGMRETETGDIESKEDVALASISANLENLGVMVSTLGSSMSQQTSIIDSSLNAPKRIARDGKGPYGIEKLINGEWQLTETIERDQSGRVAGTQPIN